MAFYRGCSKCGAEFKTPEEERSHVCCGRDKESSPHAIYRTHATVSIPGNIRIDEVVTVYANGKRVVLKRIE